MNTMASLNPLNSKKIFIISSLYIKIMNTVASLNHLKCEPPIV